MGKFVKVSISKSPRCDQTHWLWGPVTGNAAAPWWVCTPADPPLPLSLLLEPITTFSLRSEVEEPADGGPGAGQAGASSITLPVRRWGRRMCSLVSRGLGHTARGNTGRRRSGKCSLTSRPMETSGLAWKPRAMLTLFQWEKCFATSKGTIHYCMFGAASTHKIGT